MRRFRRGYGALALALLVVGVACAPVRLQRPRNTDRNLITAAEISAGSFRNAYEVIEALRGNWLHARGPDSFRSPSFVQVYVDGVRLGGIESLRTVTTAAITYIRRYDATEATARWGIDHGSGAIQVITTPAGPGSPESSAQRSP